MKQIKNVHLSAFETRKVIFDADVVERDNYPEIIEHAVNFELAWLKYKTQHYTTISNEDRERIKMLEERSGKS